MDTDTQAEDWDYGWGPQPQPWPTGSTVCLDDLPLEALSLHYGTHRLLLAHGVNTVGLLRAAFEDGQRLASISGFGGKRRREVHLALLELGDLAAPAETPPICTCPLCGQQHLRP